MIGRLAFSKAGHDKDTLYMIVGEEKDFVYVCDGKTKGIEAPKKKNRKHIQPIYKMADETIREKLLQGHPVRNEDIKRVIKVFNAQGGSNV